MGTAWRIGAVRCFALDAIPQQAMAAGILPFVGFCREKVEHSPLIAEEKGLVAGGEYVELCHFSLMYLTVMPRKALLHLFILQMVAAEHPMASAAAIVVG